MNKILKLEELGQFLLSIFLFAQLKFSWWLFLTCILLPDIGMLGYLLNTKVGATMYNIFHHKFLALVIYGFGVYSNNQSIIFIGIILFGHSAMDRMMGYGLKFNDNFKHTHLGWIGK